VLTRLLLLLVTVCLTTASAQGTTEYTVQVGDTLYSIARRHGATVEDVLRLNVLESPTLDVGQILTVPNVPEPEPTAPPATPQAAPAVPTATPKPPSGPVRGPRAWKAAPPQVTFHGFASARAIVQHTSLTGSTPAQTYLGNLPFAFQSFNNCGPASVSVVLGYYGFRVSQEDLRKVLRPRGGYMSANVISPYVKKFGLNAITVKNGNVAAVKRLVSQGIPVIVLQWLDRPGHTPHFRVVRGFDDTTGHMWVSDSMIAGAAYISYRDFDVLWNTQGRLMIPVFPKGYETHVKQLIGRL